MTLQHMLNKTLGDERIGCRRSIAEHHVVDSCERGDKLGSGTLRYQWIFGVGYLYYQRLPGRDAFAQSSDMLGE